MLPSNPRPPTSRFPNDTTFEQATYDKLEGEIRETEEKWSCEGAFIARSVQDQMQEVVDLRVSVSF